MKSKSLIDKIIDKLHEYDIEIFKTDKIKDETFIMTENVLITEKRKQIMVNFFVSTKPSTVAKILLMLQEIQEIKSIYIGDDFIFDSHGKYYEGIDAEKTFMKMQENRIINEFIEEQKELYYLTNMKGYSC